MDSTSEYLTVVATNHLAATLGTVLIRGSFQTSAGAQYIGVSLGASPNRFYVGRRSDTTGGLTVQTGSGVGVAGTVIPADTSVVIAVTYNIATTSYRALLNGAFSHVGVFGGTVVAASGLITMGGIAGTDYDVTIESAAFFNEVLADAEISRIAALATSWTWDNLQPVVGPTQAQRNHARNLKRKADIVKLAIIMGGSQ
jgi:hypothetical protein